MEALRVQAEADFAAPGAAMRQMVADLPLAPGDRVLDVGCGAGQWAALLAERVGPAGAVEGMDPNAAALALARELLDRFRPDLAGRITLAAGRGEAIPAPDGCFDLVWLSLVIHHHRDADQAATLREIGRVLRPGGWVAIRDADVAAREPILPLPTDLRARLEGIFAAAETPGEGWAPLGGPHDLYVGRHLPGLLADAGFERLAIRAYNHVIAQPLSAADLRTLRSTLVGGWRGEVLRVGLDPADWQRLDDLLTAGRPGSWLDDPTFHAFKPDVVYLARRPAAGDTFR